MIRTIALTAALALGATAASAASIKVETFSQEAYQAYLAGTNRATAEDFENIVPSSQELALVTTAVGIFDTLGGKGTGSSVIGTGTDLAVRTKGKNHSGRKNTTPGGQFYLDSNDTFGIGWNVGLAGDMSFNSVAFSLSDAADQGARLEISAMGEVLDTLVKLPNANVKFVVISFEEMIQSAMINFTNFGKGETLRTNDGFGIDDATVASVSPVPVPAAGLLLLGALGGLGLRARRKA